MLLPLLLTALAASQDVEPKPVWTGAVTAGLSATEGNTDLKKASATADAKKELADSRYTVGLSWNFSQESDLITQRKSFGKAQYDRFFTEKTYWLAQSSAEADAQAGVDLRTTLGAGAGRQFLATDKWDASAELGLTWFNQEEAASESQSYMAARMAYNLGWKPNDRWEFLQSAEVYPSVGDTADVYSKLDTRVKATLGDNMFAQVQWVMDWDNTPASGADRVDSLYLLTVGWKF
jgi:putative salt-induced outer membrane protein YdiY